MASTTTRVTFRVVVGILAILVLFYVGRPLYWKISATVQEIRENKRTVKQGISQIVFEAQKSVGWFHDESDSGVRQNRRLRIGACPPASETANNARNGINHSS
ncbi:hypothetical protein SADUNF_Sadunf08G0175900 [Salix dunnii]|uniref:Low-density receptor-like protein n=1 Tax=Salix dunnii TaxID=1413687 RepID=A0A835JV43_9ROSI|nr:hypothetical protein SADUNF_Sadunf08G0175900 [Salix dunnii]